MSFFGTVQEAGTLVSITTLPLEVRKSIRSNTSLNRSRIFNCVSIVSPFDSGDLFGLRGRAEGNPVRTVGRAGGQINARVIYDRRRSRFERPLDVPPGAPPAVRAQALSDGLRPRGGRPNRPAGCARPPT